MPKKPTDSASTAPDPRDGVGLLRSVLKQTTLDVAASRVAAEAKSKTFKRELTFAIRFAKYMSEGIAQALEPDFRGTVGGEQPSRSLRGTKRVDVRYSTQEMGLGLAVSLKSVHFGERDNGRAGFTHNLKRNDEELRVEATGHHLRQPYAVMAAVVFLPFESCTDGADNRESTSSFADWVQYLWPLKGRVDPEDRPDQFELVFIALYDRDGTELGFYEVGGEARCPKRGRPSDLLSLARFIDRLKITYERRNGLDFEFAE